MNSNPRTNGVSQNRCFSRSDIRFFRTLSRGRDQFTSYIVRCKGQIGLKMYFLKLSHNMKCGMVFLPFCSSKWRQTCRCFGNTVNRNLYRTSFKLKHKTFWERGGGILSQYIKCHRQNSLIGLSWQFVDWQLRRNGNGSFR